MDEKLPNFYVKRITIKEGKQTEKENYAQNPNEFLPFFSFYACNGSSIGCQVSSTLRKIIIVNSNWSTRINFTEWTKERYSRDRLPPKITFSFQVDHCHQFDGELEVEVEYETLMGAGEWRDIKQRVNSLPD